MLENFSEMLKKAKKEKYAIAQFNINNLEWTKFILEECNQLEVPVILGVSESAVKHMGGYNVVVNIVKSLIKDLNIVIPVCLHLDHGKSIDECIKAIDAGFTSVMIDVSKKSLQENITATRNVVEYAHKNKVTVEAEIGYIGESSDESLMTNATLEDCIKIYEGTDIDALAPALGSVHGFYKKEPNLDFEKMSQIKEYLPIPLVLHGGTGIPKEDIKKAINSGISKININTELQNVWSKAVRKYLEENSEVYDPRKIINSGETAIKNKIKEFIELFETKKYNK